MNKPPPRMLLSAFSLIASGRPSAGPECSAYTAPRREPSNHRLGNRVKPHLRFSKWWQSSPPWWWSFRSGHSMHLRFYSPPCHHGGLFLLCQFAQALQQQWIHITRICAFVFCESRVFLTPLEAFNDVRVSGITLFFKVAEVLLKFFAVSCAIRNHYRKYAFRF